MSKVKRDTYEGMTEFEKFVYFRNKAAEMDELNSCYSLLLAHTYLTPGALRRRLHISYDRWGRYCDGTDPMPDGFLRDFKNEFYNELREAEDKSLRNYLRRTRVTLPQITPIVSETDTANI